MAEDHLVYCTNFCVMYSYIIVQSSFEQYSSANRTVQFICIPLHVFTQHTQISIYYIYPFFNCMYKSVFGKTKKLVAKPKPWRINLLLYLAHEGWLLIKKHVIKKFETSKNSKIHRILPFLTY